MALLLMASLFLLFYSLTVEDFSEQTRLSRLLKQQGISGVVAILFFLFTSALFKSPLTGIVWGFLGWFVPGWLNAAVEEKKHAAVKNMAKDFVTSTAGLYAVGQMNSDVIRLMAERFPEPFASEFEKMIAARNSNPNVSFPRMFAEMAHKYRLEEFNAVAAILAASEKVGGPVAASRGLKKLGLALRQRDSLLTERAKATMEPRLAASVVIVILLAGLLLDATALNGMFDGPGKLVLTASSALVVGLIFLVKKISKSEDLS